MSEVYNFKPLSEVELLEEPGEGTTVLAVESGAVKQIPAAKLGGGGTGGFIVTAALDVEVGGITGADKTFAEIMTAVEAGAFPVLRLDGTPMDQGYLYLTVMQVVPEAAISFSADVFGSGATIICTSDNQWVIQESGGNV